MKMIPNTTTADPRLEFVWRATTRAMIVLGYLLCFLLLGCATLRHHGPIDENDLRSRRFAQRGMDAMQAGAWKDAEKNFGKALRHCPNDETVLEMYAECLASNGQSRDAMRQLAKVIDVSDGKNSAAIVMLGELLFRNGNLQEAMVRAEQAIRVEPTNSRAWALRGAVLERRGNLELALASLQRAMSYDSNCPNLQMSVAEIYHQLKRPRRTLATLDQFEFESDQPIPIRALHLRGLAWLDLNQYDEAVIALAAAHERFDEPSSDILIDLASAQLQAKQFASAEWSANQASGVARADQQSKIADLQNQIRLVQSGKNEAKVAEGAIPSRR